MRKLVAPIALAMIAASCTDSAKDAIDPIISASRNQSGVERVAPPVWDGQHNSHYTSAQFKSALANTALGSSFIGSISEVGGHYQAAILSASTAGFPLDGSNYLSISAGDARTPGNGLNNGPCAGDVFYNSLCDVGGINVQVMIPADASRLRLDYRYWAVDYDPFEDPFWIVLDAGNGNLVRFAESTLTTEWNGKSYGFEYAPTIRCAIVDVSPHRGKTVTLQFRAANRYDHALPSGALVDNLRFDDASACALPPNPNEPNVPNAPPVANAGADQTLARTSASGVSVSLDGTGSTDSDGTVSSYDWSENGSSIASGPTPSIMLGLGSHTITLTVTDDKGATHTDVVVIDVQNVAPVANAGADQSEFRTSATGVAITLNGAASSDLDGTVDSYQWSENGVVFASGVSPTHTFTLGTHNVNLEVTDNNGTTHSDMVVITVKNVVPIARAGANQTLECVSGGALAHLDGSTSFDLDGTISYLWTTGATTATTSKIFGLGTTNVGLTVTDNNGATDSDGVQITVVDTKKPTISMMVSPATLWSPNHKMVKVASGISATDGCHGGTALSVAVTSNEPVNGLGDGDTAPDWTVVNNGNGTFDVSVRAERSGTGTGRIYTITAISVDGSGNTATSTGTVTVPHSQKK